MLVELKVLCPSFADVPRSLAIQILLLSGGRSLYPTSAVIPQSLYIFKTSWGAASVTLVRPRYFISSNYGNSLPLLYNLLVMVNRNSASTGQGISLTAYCCHLNHPISVQYCTPRCQSHVIHEPNHPLACWSRISRFLVIHHHCAWWTLISHFCPYSTITIEKKLWIRLCLGRVISSCQTTETLFHCYIISW